MASTRRAVSSLLSSPLCRTCLRTQIVRPAQRIANLCSFSQPALKPAFTQRRWHSTPADSTKVYNFDQMKQYTESPSSDRILIDVREPSEYEQGYIPTAINIPIKSQPDALFLPADEFEDRFGFPKPDAEKKLVFYCKSGVRSSAAAQLASQVGYQDVAEYRGSWMDWTKRGGEESKP